MSYFATFSASVGRQNENQMLVKSICGFSLCSNKAESVGDEQ